jgi:hypothetical protein
MTEPKWMKGPYEVAKRGTYPDDEGHKVLAPEQINSKGKPYRLYAAQFVPSLAEASLFSAAPDLDEALGGLMAAIVCLDLPEKPAYLKVAMDIAHAAREKARGKVKP